jgi:triacylglycerol esterase/lipase EstA (alpha/beta hydrolase family)
MRAVVFTIIFLIAWGSSSSYGEMTQDDILYAKNHLIILVHGIGDDHKCFDNVKASLESNGLLGYVYAYEFSDQFLNIEKEG